MFLIGCHLSCGKGYLAMGKEAVKLDASTFQFFTRNPRGGNVKALDEEDIRKFLEFKKEHKIGTLIAHAPYTMNACSPKEEVRDFARRVMKEDLERLEFLPGNYYNFHPGSYVSQDVETGIGQIADALNQVLTPDLKTTVLLETMAGKGSEIGRCFEELREIIDRTDHPEQMGVLMDTCHVWDAGYDIAGDLDGVLSEFDRIVGLEKLRAIHLNDSQNDRGAAKDRHARLGEGKIGLEALLRIINHPVLRDLPFCLETPNDLPGYQREIAMLRANRTKI